MDEESRSESSEDRDYTEPTEPEADLPASTIIGANITGANTGTYVGGVIGPASEVAEDRGGQGAYRGYGGNGSARCPEERGRGRGSGRDQL